MTHSKFHTYRQNLRKISPPTGIRSPDRPARSQSLYRLSYPGPQVITKHNINIFVLTEPRTGRSGIRTPAETRDFSVVKNVPKVFERPTQIQNSMGSESYFTELKRQGREAGHSPHLIPKLRMSGIRPRNPLYAFMEQTRTKFL